MDGSVPFTLLVGLDSDPFIPHLVAAVDAIERKLVSRLIRRICVMQVNLRPSRQSDDTGGALLWARPTGLDRQ